MTSGLKKVEEQIKAILLYVSTIPHQTKQGEHMDEAFPKKIMGLSKQYDTIR